MAKTDESEKQLLKAIVKAEKNETANVWKQHLYVHVPMYVCIYVCMCAGFSVCKYVCMYVWDCGR